MSAFDAGSGPGESADGTETRIHRLVGIVLNWRDAASTTACVRSLLADSQVERVIVVDNEAEGLLGGLSEERVTVLEQSENLGFARGVNVGIREAGKAGFDALFIVNNDATVDEHCIAELVKAWEVDRERAGLIAPVVVNPDRTVQSTGGRFCPLTASNSDRASGPRLDYVTWAGVLLPRRTIEAVGLLDEAYFMYWEDVDYGLRTTDAGLMIQVVGAATITHEKSKSHGRAGVAIDRYGAHGLVVLARRRRGWLLFVGMPLRLVSRVARRLISGRPDRVRAVLEGARSGWKAAACSS